MSDDQFSTGLQLARRMAQAMDARAAVMIFWPRDGEPQVVAVADDETTLAEVRADAPRVLNSLGTPKAHQVMKPKASDNALWFILFAMVALIALLTSLSVTP